MIVLKYWKEIVMCVLVAFIAYGVIDYLGQRQQIAGLNLQLKNRDERIVELIKSDKEKTDKLRAIDASAAELRKNHLAAEQRRLQVISNLTKQISAVQQQQVPKDCQKAIEFAIEHKADLSW